MRSIWPLVRSSTWAQAHLAARRGHMGHLAASRCRFGDLRRFTFNLRVLACRTEGARLRLAPMYVKARITRSVGASSMAFALRAKGRAAAPSALRRGLRRGAATCGKGGGQGSMDGSAHRPSATFFVRRRDALRNLHKSPHGRVVALSRPHAAPTLQLVAHCAAIGAEFRAAACGLRLRSACGRGGGRGGRGGDRARRARPRIYI